MKTEFEMKKMKYIGYCYKVRIGEISYIAERYAWEKYIMHRDLAKQKRLFDWLKENILPYKDPDCRVSYNTPSSAAIALMAGGALGEFISNEEVKFLLAHMQLESCESFSFELNYSITPKSNELLSKYCF